MQFSRSHYIKFQTIVVFFLIVGHFRLWASDQQANHHSREYDFEGEMFSKLSSDELSLLSEYASKYTHLQKFYNNLSMNASEEVTSFPRKNEEIFPPSPDSALTLTLTAKNDYFYCSNLNAGTYYRLDKNRYDLTDPKKILESEVGIVTPDECYFLTRNGNSPNYILQAHGKFKKQYLSKIRSYTFTSAPYAIFGSPIVRSILVNRKGFTIDSVKTEKESEEDLITIKQSTKNDKGSAFWTYRFYRGNWALKDMIATSNENDGSKHIHSQLCTYDDINPDKIPYLQKCVIEYSVQKSKSDKERLNFQKVFTITKFNPTECPLAEIEIAQELVGKVGKKSTSTYYRNLSIMVGITLVLICICYNAFRKQSENKSGPV